ncbi:Predicted flavoprotein CzcO associated with the cation diffusion facilitator CzcD [Amycolatopsis marina]|uniref:Predicted flavoprotein CzcO associated with the cation diffusion facilitator CzcD n=1 Tax=Amycolatopsis marina TaxID=490629 RepID=A0A1I0YK25_9PSEU|nr:NAD(P)/FAD-dependent oxidoreductase [Amycolatopsis marina]SFB13684.1 Predicted flavoprotein CzcO associated with the cation diffusion facilitator CzcD [Amycolatopsis marina]
MGKRTEAGVIIVGSGFSGLGMAIQLRKEGREDFVILEKAQDVGGTWRDNTYPGCACDIQSHMYSFSFEQNPNWSRSFSPQPEIWDYMRGVAEKYDLYRFVRFGQEMTGARWDEEEGRWHVATASGDEFVGRFLVSGMGALHIPQIPQLPGLERFEGRQFHSAQWDHDYDLRDKRVAVVGTGASSIQFVPQIAKDVRELTLFQRTPPWIMPKPDHEMPEWTKKLFNKVPGVQRMYRNALYWMLEVRAIGFNGHAGVMKLAQKIAKWNIDKNIKDPRLRAKLTPDYTMGCKRVLISNDFYPALNRQNVDVVTDGIAEVREHSIVDSAGVEREVDAIIFGTGFHVTDAFDNLEVIGREGRNLGKEWATEGMQTHKGITVSGFPNLFFLLGPNTGLGHNSVVFMIESQIRYVSAAMRLVESAGADGIEARPDSQAQFNSDIQRKLAKGIWTQGGCKSWYLDAKGVNRTVWPGFTWRYWLQTRKVDTSEYSLVGIADTGEAAKESEQPSVPTA